MDLKNIAKASIEESANADAPIAIKDNGDGTTTYSLTFSLDPKVQAEMSKAMPKGQRRDDQPDIISDGESDEDQENVSPEEGLFATDSVAEDALPSRHANTPLENCRAKDPMFCPYHGKKAIEEFISSGLSASVPNLLLNRQVTFSVKENPDKTFSVSITGPSAYNSAAFSSVLQNLVSRKGIVPVSQFEVDYGGSGNPQEHKVSIQAKPEFDKPSMLHEWADDLMIDVANDPKLQNELDPKEFADFLEKMGEMDRENAQNQGTQQAKKAEEDAIAAYRSIRGQADNTDVSSVGHLNDVDRDTAFRANLGTELYFLAKSEADSYKRALFGGSGNLPRGFSKQNEFAEKYTKASSEVGHWDRTAFLDADSDALENINKGTTDVKSLRINAGDLRRTSAKLEDDAATFADKKVPEFITGLYDWAVQNNHPNLNKAFPNGKPTEFESQKYGPVQDGMYIIDPNRLDDKTPIGITGDCSISSMPWKKIERMPRVVQGSISIYNLTDLDSLDGIGDTKLNVGIFSCDSLKNLEHFPQGATTAYIDNNKSLESVKGLPGEMRRLTISNAPNLKSLDGAPVKVSVFDFQNTGLSQQQIADYQNFLTTQDPAHIDKNGRYKE